MCPRNYVPGIRAPEFSPEFERCPRNSEFGMVSPNCATASSFEVVAGERQSSGRPSGARSRAAAGADGWVSATFSRPPALAQCDPPRDFAFGSGP
jgi:hypothetical protein